MSKRLGIAAKKQGSLVMVLLSTVTISGKSLPDVDDRCFRGDGARLHAWSRVGGIEQEHVRTNAAREVPYLKGKPGGFHSWEMGEVQKFQERHPIGTKARLALGLLLYTGQRRSDIVLFGRQHVHQGALKFTQGRDETDHQSVWNCQSCPSCRRSSMPARPAT